MSVLDKLMFWKKEDDFDIDFDKSVDKEMQKSDDLFKTDDLGLDQKPAGLDEKSPFDQPATEETKSQPWEQPKQEPTAVQQLQQQTPGSSTRELELLSSKLDTIKAILNSMDQRIANIESSTGTAKKEDKLW
jgi:hypothetical protein